jgi:tetratricopeptide (TPR) repeat protein
VDLTEVKRKYAQAQALYTQGNPAEALAILNELDREFPNAQKVTYLRATCLAALGRIEEAIELAVYLSNVLEDPRGQELQLRLERARAAPGKPAQVDFKQLPKPVKKASCLGCGCMLFPVILVLLSALPRGCREMSKRVDRELRRPRQTAPARPGRSAPRRPIPRRGSRP